MPWMPGPRRWTPLETELLQDCAVFTVSRAPARSPDGRDHDFFRIDSSDWVNVVPLTAAGEVVMIRQYRHGLRDLTLEIPGGLIDPGEEPATAAGRELVEETGYRAAELLAIGATSPNPALFGNRVHTYLATGLERVGAPSNPGTEETVVELVPEATLRGIVRGGGVDHALVIAALHFLDLHREAGEPGHSASGRG
jgi:8-oxo-dGTP pyrophosphatase MutT (NUDIX family)